MTKFTIKADIILTTFENLKPDEKLVIVLAVEQALNKMRPIELPAQSGLKKVAIRVHIKP